MPPQLPVDPFALVPDPGYRPREQRTVEVFGAPAELVWLPSRRDRDGAPSADPPAFRPSRIERILREETCWSGAGCALTPNRHPLAPREVLLWAETTQREPDGALLEVALALEERVGGTVLVNSIGAAASLARAHVHLVAEPLPFLDRLPRCPRRLDGIDLPGALEVLELAPPFPVLSVGLRGPAAHRARALQVLLEARSAPAFNIVSQTGTSWLFPRSAVEIPEPHFPTALGASELWGRWFFVERRPFERTTGRDLEAAIAAAGVPRPAE